MEDAARSSCRRAALAWPPLPALLAIIALLAAAGCNEPGSPAAHPTQSTAPASAVEPCAAEPLNAFDALEEGTYATASRISGETVGIESEDSFGRAHFIIRDDAGAEHRIAMVIAGPMPPLEQGRSYDFALEREGGTPPAASLVVRDDHGILFAGASDQDIAAHVLQRGIEGFTFRLLATTCASRPHDNCLKSVANRGLEVTHDGRSATLYNGDVAHLGDYEVRCLIAQRAEYAAGCADVGLYGVSYTIARMK